MSKMSGGQKPPELLSSHPSDDKRIADLQAIMDETVKVYYKPVK
jgi:Zn-dependent protease with chaperone function